MAKFDLITVDANSPWYHRVEAEGYERAREVARAAIGESVVVKLVEVTPECDGLPVWVVHGTGASGVPEFDVVYTASKDLDAIMAYAGSNLKFSNVRASPAKPGVADSAAPPFKPSARSVGSAPSWVGVGLAEVGEQEYRRAVMKIADSGMVRAPVWTVVKGVVLGLVVYGVLVAILWLALWLFSGAMEG